MSDQSDSQWAAGRSSVQLRESFSGDSSSPRLCITHKSKCESNYVNNYRILIRTANHLRFSDSLVNEFNAPLWRWPIVSHNVHSNHQNTFGTHSHTRPVSLGSLWRTACGRTDSIRTKSDCKWARDAESRQWCGSMRLTDNNGHLIVRPTAWFCLLSFESVCHKYRRLSFRIFDFERSLVRNIWTHLLGSFNELPLQWTLYNCKASARLQRRLVSVAVYR